MDRLTLAEARGLRRCLWYPVRRTRKRLYNIVPFHFPLGVESSVL